MTQANVDQRSDALAEPYDLLETQEDLWSHNVHEGTRVLTNISLNSLKERYFPKGTRCLCLKVICDVIVPKLDTLGHMTTTMLRSFVVLIDDVPYSYLGVGEEGAFDRVFRVIARFVDAM